MRAGFVGLIILLFGLMSCTSVQLVGKVNMISNRNIDSSLDYVPIANYAGGDMYAVRRTRALSIEEAVDRTVRSTPGGEFLMNAKIYLVNGRYFAVEGDVWGNIEDIQFKGFKVGDNVAWRKGRVQYLGEITALKSEFTCIVETDGAFIEVEYAVLSKVNP